MMTIIIPFLAVAQNDFFVEIDAATDATELQQVVDAVIEVSDFENTANLITDLDDLKSYYKELYSSTLPLDQKFNLINVRLIELERRTIPISLGTTAYILKRNDSTGWYSWPTGQAVTIQGWEYQVNESGEQIWFAYLIEGKRRVRVQKAHMGQRWSTEI